MIPVTVLTGFLGAGKTTLLNRLLAGRKNLRVAVIENEFGEVGVDNELVIEADEELFAMNNGCICCTVRGDLIRILHKLAQRPEKVDAVIIETTGLADPGPVAQTFFTDEGVRAAFRLDAIVTVVDARHIAQHWDDSEEAKKQIAFADVILLNKTDLAESARLEIVERRIRQMNPAAKLHRTSHAELPLEAVLGRGGFDLRRANEVDPKFLEPEFPFEAACVYSPVQTEAGLVLEAGPDPTMDLVLLPLAAPTPEALEEAVHTAVLAFSSPPVERKAGEMLDEPGLRYRLHLGGVLNRFPLGKPGQGAFAAFTQHHPEEFALRLEGKESGQPLVPESVRSFKPKHEHSEEVGSVGFEFAGDLDPACLNVWLSDLLKNKGTDLFRSKGVLCVAGSDLRLVFQGVHMMFDSRFDRPWGKDEERLNRFVFIGRNLDRSALKAGFEGCLLRKLPTTEDSTGE